MARIYDNAEGTISAADLASSGATVVGGTVHDFENTNHVILANGYLRVRLPPVGDSSGQFDVFLREPAVATSDSDEHFDPDNPLPITVAPDSGSETVSGADIVANSVDETIVEVRYNSGNKYRLTIHQQLPYIIIDSFRGERDSTHQQHDVGIGADHRFTIIGDGEVLRDDTIHSSTQTTSNNGDGWAVSFDADDHWLPGITTAHKWSSLRDDGNLIARVTDAGVNQWRRQTVFFTPTYQGEAINAGNHWGVDASGESKDNTYSDVLFTNAGAYRFLFAPTNTNGVDDVQIDVGGTTVYTHGSSINQNTFVSTPLVFVDQGSNSVRVNVTDGDKADADYVFFFIPVYRSTSTDPESLLAFPGMLANMNYADKVQRTDVGNIN